MRAFFVSLAVLGGALPLAGCGAEGPIAESVSAEPSDEIDWKYQLTRTDEVEVCVQGMTRQKSVGEHALLSNEAITASCECLHDSVRAQLGEREIGNPALENAILQLTVNVEFIETVMAVDVRDERIPAMYAWLKTEGLREVGFDDAQMLAVVEADVEAWPAEKAVNFGRTNKACIKSDEALRRQFPGLDNTDPSKGISAKLAEHWMGLDEALDKSVVDQILFAAPREEAKSIFNAVVHLPEACANRQSIQSVNAAECISENMGLADLSDADREMAERIVWALLYMSEMNSLELSSMQLPYDYVLSRSTRLTISGGDLRRISEGVQNDAGRQTFMQLAQIFEEAEEGARSAAEFAL